jgi:transcriptional regulator with XRE-family HTH domain
MSRVAGGAVKEPKPDPKAAGAGDAAMGMRVREARLAAGVSQEKLGAILGVTFQQVQKYEKGVNRISSGRLKLLAETFDRPLSYFFGDGEDADLISVRAGLMNRQAVTMLRYFNKLPEAQQRAIVAATRAMVLSANGREEDDSV